MELTSIQKHLIVGLRVFDVEKDAIVGIVSAMETEAQQCALMEWMAENKEAKTPEILRKVAELATKK